MPKDPTMRLIGRLRREHSLTRVDISVGAHGVVARAMPDSFNATVKGRREVAYSAKGQLSMAEATAITEQSLAAVADGRGDSIQAALDALKVALANPPLT